METFYWNLLLVLFGPLVSPSSLVKDSTSCQSANVSLTEGASKVVVANVSTYSKNLLLWKSNDSSSDWQEILYVTEGQINPLYPAYADYFYMSGNDLAIQNAIEALTGYYKLTYGFKDYCVQQFHLEILGSRAIHNSTSSKIIYWILVPMALVLGLACLVIYKYYKWRRERKRNGVIYYSTGLPDSENGAVHVEVCNEVKWTDKLRRFFALRRKKCLCVE